MTDDPVSRRLSRRGALALGVAAAGSLAGCAGLSAPRAGPGTGTPPASSDGPERPETVFQATVERSGYWPDRRVPGGVQADWAIPGLNKGDHTAAKPSALAYRGNVLVAGDVNTVFSYTPGGELNWATALQPSNYGTHATPAVVDGTLYTSGYDGAVYAIDTASGAVEWRTEVADAIGSSPNYYDGFVYIATEFYTPSGGMTILDATTGEAVWEDSRPTNHCHSQTGIDTQGRAFAAGSNDGRLYVWDLDEWSFRGRFETDGAIKGPVCMHEGTALFGSWDHSVYAVDTETVERVWEHGTDDKVMSGVAVHPGEGLAVTGGHDGTLRALDVASGDEVWTVDTGGSIVGSPTIAGDTALVGSYDSALYAVDVPSGRRRWRFAEPSGIVTASPLVHDGAVYFADRATDDTTGHLYRLSA
jgi:outer membrane protein assembly factor BamB